MNELQRTLNWFELAVPNPTEKNQSVQVGCWAEECGEVLTALGHNPKFDTLEDIAWDYKTGADTYLGHKQRIELLDGICDVIVTAVGIAHMYGMDIVGAMSEVNRSNFSKFVDGKPVFNEQGKIAKPETYSPPNFHTILS